jgi:hypothetical protein
MAAANSGLAKAGLTNKGKLYIFIQQRCMRRLTDHRLPCLRQADER